MYMRKSDNNIRIVEWLCPYCECGVESPNFGASKLQNSQVIIDIVIPQAILLSGTDEITLDRAEFVIFYWIIENLCRIYW